MAGGTDADTDANLQSSPTGVIFRLASAIADTAAAPVQTDLRRCIKSAFVGRGQLENFDAKEMLAYQRSVFSVNAGVCRIAPLQTLTQLMGTAASALESIKNCAKL